MVADAPIITTIIPTYRRPDLLRRAIRSALNQTYPYLRVCVYDNASGDETADVVAKLALEDARVQYHCHATNIGMVANFNYGLTHIETPLFSILSDDDILLPLFYEEALKGFRHFPDAVFSACDVIHVNDDNKIVDAPLSFWPREGYFAPPEGVFEMLRGRHPTITGILFRKEVIERFGVLSNTIVFSDVELELRIAVRAPFYISKQPGALFIAHASSYSVQTDLPILWRDYNRIMNLIQHEMLLSEENRIRIIEITVQYLYPIVRGMGIRAIVRKHFDVARLSVLIMSERYSRRIEVIVLVLCIVICERFGLALRIFRAIHSAGKKMKYTSEKTTLQHTFGIYTRYL